MYYLIGWSPDGTVYIIQESDNYELLKFYKNQEQNSSGHYVNDWQKLVIVKEVTDASRI